jgi:hypothetical protein
MDTAKSEKAVMIKAKIYRRTPENLDMVQLINVTSIDVHLDINGLRIEIGSMDFHSKMWTRLYLDYTFVVGLSERPSSFKHS